jgi:D-aminoacyl-tRNA deacylase
MRAVVQRVSHASVVVDSQSVGAIGPGLLVLLGIGKGDGLEHVKWMVDKIAGLRIFEDANGKMNHSLLDTSKSLLAISQFTLYADSSKGRRPSFIDAMPPAEANVLYRAFCDCGEGLGLTVARGIFGADMKVTLLNDGPVTICLDSRDRT